ncbi:hypothetical protein EVAR_24743_1 [Eumeta japonica]|uniref:Uncharacterized protein n=1 Tax=Eumeta variegata TaxID=151549 RepID=A0A4C1VDX9_EUMVA|nr:hypothetical protein EVAR_24743_1 [Eumeta japonica]
MRLGLNSSAWLLKRLRPPSRGQNLRVLITLSGGEPRASINPPNAGTTRPGDLFAARPDPMDLSRCTAPEREAAGRRAD